jgi:MFS transporter, DHA1 family, multidrug resistance protein
VLLAAAGFQVTFAALAVIGLAAFFAGLGSPARPPRTGQPRRGLIAGYAPLLRRRIIHYSILCAYLSALPFSLSISFYPLLLTYYGYGEEVSGVIMALRAVGSIAASLLAARFVRTGPQTLWPVVCGIAVAGGVGLTPTVNHEAAIALWMLVVGAGSAAMTLYFQITMSEASLQEERGSALALGGLGWSVSHLTTPLVMGFLADRYGLVVAFYAVGAFALVCALTIAWARRWAFRQP